MASAADERDVVLVGIHGREPRRTRPPPCHRTRSGDGAAGTDGTHVGFDAHLRRCGRARRTSRAGAAGPRHHGKSRARPRAGRSGCSPVGTARPNAWCSAWSNRRRGRFDAAGAHVVDLGRGDGERSDMTKRDRSDHRAQADGVRVPREARERRPVVGRCLAPTDRPILRIWSERKNAPKPHSSAGTRT